jgi:superfamily II DNA or RNA helicase
MAQADLFAVDQTISLDLPILNYGPVQLGIGQVRRIVRFDEKVEARSEGEVFVSARIKEPLYRLPSGETVVVTTRKIATRPPEADAVLFREADGTLRWLKHRALEAIDQRVADAGWKVALDELANAWNGRFLFQAERPEADGTVRPGNEGLRPPQVGALHAIGAHWSLYQQPATVVMPTGTGKTETMLSTMAAYARKPVLVIVPSDALRSQTARKFLSFGLLRKLGVLLDGAPNPYVGVITKVPKKAEDLEIFERSNVVIATMSALADAEALWPRIADAVGLLIVDEAHHIGAKTWSGFREAFRGKPTLQFTATPFRRDGKLVDGHVIYNYPLRMAQTDGYFKPITFDPVYEPILDQADEAIAIAAVARLRDDLAGGFNHLLMARCRTIERATAVFAIYRRLAPDLNPILLHSKLNDTDSRVDDLRAGKHRIAVCVNMLGEGFDLPELKVAAIHDLHKSLAVLLQFTGRFTRSTGDRIGDASVVANIAEPNVSSALERLYSEDADWNQLLSELSSQAAREHAKLMEFLNASKRLDDSLDDDTAISHQLLRPTLSTLFYEAPNFKPRSFHAGLPESMIPHAVWLNEASNTLFFVTRTEPFLKWTRARSVRDRTWDLFILHYDEARKLLYLSSSDHDSAFEDLAKAVGATRLIFGDVMFRSLGRISRLLFQNVGVKKHGRRNLSYAMYTGADVKQALGLSEKAGSVKSNLSGTGWEGGRQITIGCSFKGRVWSREQGSIPRFTEWCETVGDKLLDGSIDTSKLIDNVLIPNEVFALPAADPFSIEWPLEMLRQAEERVTFRNGTSEGAMTTFELVLGTTDRAADAIDFELVEATRGTWGTFRFKLGGEHGFSVSQVAGATVRVTVGKLQQTLADYFSNYPPLFRLVDLTELDANLHIGPQIPQTLVISEDRFETWEWAGVDFKKESLWKAGVERTDSIQAHAARHYIESGFDVVFDDDAAGEAADLVCMKIEDGFIRVAFVHCKFAGGATPGERIKDVVEVSSQAVRSAKWSGKFPQLCQHIRNREATLRRADRPTRFLAGSAADINKMVKLNRAMPVKPEVLIAQPGLSKANRTPDQTVVLAAALTFLRETIDVDLTIVCSE